MHIPKAAGQTIYGIVGRQYPRPEVLILGGRLGQTSLPPIDDARRAKIILGHVHYGLHRHLDGDNTYVTLLREPVPRVLSLYRYIAMSPQHYLHEQVANATLLDFVSSEVDAAEVENGQVRQIAGLTRGVADTSTLVRAKQNLAETFRVVGLVERFDESVLLFKRNLGWKMPLYARKNVTRGVLPSNATDDKALDIIKRRNALDIELYGFACDLFEQQIRREGPLFGVEVSMFRALNTTAGFGRAGRDVTRELRRRGGRSV